MGDVRTTRSGMEQRLQATTQLNARKQQEIVAVQCQLKGLQQQVDSLRQTIGEVSAKMDVRFQDLDRVLKEVVLIEKSELNNRLQKLDKSLNQLQQRSQDASMTR